MNAFKNTRGSSSVFILIILGSMITLTMVFILASEKISERAYCEEVMYLSGRSVLAEYDVKLKEDYGIFAFQGSELSVSDKLGEYSSYSFKNKESLDMKDLSVDFSGYSLYEQEVFEDEVTGYVKYALARDFICDGSLNCWNENPIDDSGTRVLRNNRIISQLPSVGMEDSGHLWEKVKAFIGDIGNIFEEGTDNYFIDLYIMTMFKNAQNQEVGHDTFFKNEGEYILEGKYSDKDNLTAFMNDILLLRNALNAIFLIMDPEKMEIITAAAASMSGPGAPVAEALLVEIWAYAEAENDLALLVDGKRVPVYKNSETWATDLNSILGFESSEGDGLPYIDTGCESGLSYQDYLRIFLFFMDHDVKAARMMDLIQINMEGNYDEAFLIKDMSTGFNVSYRLDERKYSMSHEY